MYLSLHLIILPRICDQLQLADQFPLHVKRSIKPTQIEVKVIERV